MSAMAEIPGSATTDRPVSQETSKHCITGSLCEESWAVTDVTISLNISYNDLPRSEHIFVIFQLKFNICVGCDMAWIIEPMHRNKLNVTYLTLS